MRVALLSYNAQFHNAVGNHVAEKARFFQERGADVRVFVQDARRLHPDLRSCSREISEPSVDGPVWDYLRQADLVFAVYGQYYDLLQYLPRLAGTGPRIVFDYLGVTPPQFWNDQHREILEKSSQMRGYIWCADHALTISDANRQELLDATNFPDEHVTTQPLAVDFDAFRTDMDARFLHQKLGIDGRILLFVGRLAGNKRVPLLIEALARLDDATLHVVIVGDFHDVYAAEAGRCLELAKKLNVDRRVHFLGEFTDADLAKAYRSADALVMPSLHEGFCVPVIEAMSCGCPVIASRCTALPETVGDAGLTFTPNDADDLAQQIRRVLAMPRSCVAKEKQRIAVVSFRFGSQIVGGAETSLRTMAQTLLRAGHLVEVFTTCTNTESDWHNDFSAETATLDGLTVHRFPIDPHDHAAHGEIVRAILDADGRVPLELQERYLELSIHSTALLNALRSRRHELDAIITGPYLFGLTADTAREFPHQTLIVPCFHDEPLARLSVWPTLYGICGGILYHSAEEQELAQTRFGVNHPNSTIIGTSLPSSADQPLPPLPGKLQRPYVVYCGRYSEQKNVPLLLDWARKYQEQRPGQLNFVFMGQGEIKLPNAPWLHDLGRVDENMKRTVLAGAKALVQLSLQESLSLVALEAWAQRTPILVHFDCTVLVGQVDRSRGGAVVADFAAFAKTLDHWLADDDARRECGTNGRAYVFENYVSEEKYASRIGECIHRLGVPLSQQMRERGLERARSFSRKRWQERFAEFVEQLLMQPARSGQSDVRVEPLRTSVHAAGTPKLLLPVRLLNDGTRAAVPDGPGRTVVCWEIRAAASDAVVTRCAEIPLPALVMPGQALVAVVPIETPVDEGNYVVRLWTERWDTLAPPVAVAEVAMTVDCETSSAESCISVFLDTIAKTLPKAHHLQQLPADYVDVTEGAFASVKRLIKRKALQNFKHAYVDVLSRQQSQVNGHLVLMVQQLAECCAMLDQRLAALEKTRAEVTATADSQCSHHAPRDAVLQRP